MSKDILMQIGGFYDGDGYVGLTGGKYLCLSISQAEKGLAMLKYIQNHIGGTISTESLIRQNSQTLYKWQIGGQNAVNAASVLKDYTFLKQDQLALAASFKPRRRRTITITHEDGIKEVFTDMNACARQYDVAKQTLQKYFAGKSIKPSVFGSSMCEREFRDIAKLDVDLRQLDQKLQSLKRTEDKPIEEVLPLPYVAGFIDSDGYIGLVRLKPARVQVGQKYVSILNALQKQFGGNVCAGRTSYSWDIYSTNAIKVLKMIRPFLINKRAQADLILNMQDGQGAEVKAQLRALVGNQGKPHPNVNGRSAGSGVGLDA